MKKSDDFVSVFDAIFSSGINIVAAILDFIVVVALLFTGIIFSPLYLIVLFLLCLLACWVYSDADKRHSDCPFLWASFCFLICILGLPSYLVFRPDLSVKKKYDDSLSPVELCPHCGKYYRGRSKFCPNCGHELG